MNRAKIESLNREINQLIRDLDSCDAAVKEITRAQGAAQAVVTRLNSEPVRNQSKITDAQRNLDITKQEYDRTSRKYYQILENIRQKNMELKQEETNSLSLRSSFRR